MSYLNYLRSALPDKKEGWTRGLNEILMSNSLKIGIPYDENLNLLLFKYKRRSVLSGDGESEMFGINDLIKRLSSCADEHKAKVCPLRNNSFSGECVIMNDKIIGCAFIKRGRSCSKEGLWVDGNKID